MRRAWDAATPTKSTCLQQAPNTHLTARFLLVAILAYGLFFALGVAVAHRLPGELDVASHVLIGHGNLLAWLLTESVYLAFLAPLCLLLLVAGIVRPRWRARIIVSIAVLVAMWAASDVLQHFFMRPRRLDWIVKHETAYSYPSSHATLATAFYGFWAYLFARSELPQGTRVTAAAALGTLVAAILWARLALGAHYPTDLAGGVLLGLCGVSLALALCSALRIKLYPGFLGD